MNNPVNGWEENLCVQFISKDLIQWLETSGEPGSKTALVHLGKNQRTDRKPHMAECACSHLIIYLSLVNGLRGACPSNIYGKRRKNNPWICFHGL